MSWGFKSSCESDLVVSPASTGHQRGCLPEVFSHLSLLLGQLFGEKMGVLVKAIG